MKKLKSSLLNMTASLGITTALAGLMLGAVNHLTAEPRQKAEQQKRLSALESITDRFDNDPAAEAVELTVTDGEHVTVYPTRLNGQLTGAAVESTSKNGFSGDIRIMTGFDINGDITGYQVLAHAETPGLGAKMTDWFTGQGARNIKGLNPSEALLSVTKDGGTVDGITAATISSRAFLEAVNTAAEGYRQYMNTENGKEEAQ